MSKLIINCETGEVTERELNKAEQDQKKIDEAAYNATQAIRQAEINAKATAKAALLSKLGITAEEAVLLFS
jgi:hypothetical protein